MHAVIACLVRLAAIVFGYALACLAAGAFLSLLFFGAHDLGSEEARDIALASSLVSIPVLALVISHVAFVPAAVAIVVAELLAWRDWLSYALAGGATAVAAELLPRGTTSGLERDAGALAAMAAAGMLAGMVYWTIAGRRAGGCAALRRPTSPGP